MKTKIFIKRWISLMGICSMIVLISACTAGKKKPEEYTRTDFVMDTVLSEKLYAQKDLTGEIKDRLSELEKKKLSWRVKDSEVSKVNQSASVGTTYEMNPDFSTWAFCSLNLAKKSEGAFDPTIGELTRLWNIEGDHPKVPPEKKIAVALEKIGYENIKIKNNEIRIKDGATLDLGAVGKGIGCDVVREYLKTQKSVQGAVISVGGSILVYGEKEGGQDWKVAVRAPDGEMDSSMGVLHLSGTACISTSGDYEKYFVENGKKYHHILDPATGYPAESNLRSVTVVCAKGEETDGLLSDGLSTACFVLGKEKGMQLLEDYGADGVFIDKEKQVYVTPGLKEQFEILSKEYHFTK